MKEANLVCNLEGDLILMTSTSWIDVSEDEIIPQGDYNFIMCWDGEKDSYLSDIVNKKAKLTESKFAVKLCSEGDWYYLDQI